MEKMDAAKLSYEMYNETAAQKFRRKAVADPFVPIGILGFIGALGWGAFSYKNRGKTSTSIFLMRLRVVAQTMVVGAMAVGAGATMLKSYNKKSEK